MSEAVAEDGAVDFQQVGTAQFTHGTAENHEHVDAGLDGGAVFISTGGSVEQTADRYETFAYPEAAKPALLVDFEQRVPCLDRAQTDAEVADCFGAGEAGGPSEASGGGGPSYSYDYATLIDMDVPSSVGRHATAAGVGAMVLVSLLLSST